MIRGAFFIAGAGMDTVGVDWRLEWVYVTKKLRESGLDLSKIKLVSDGTGFIDPRTLSLEWKITAWNHGHEDDAILKFARHIGMKYGTFRHKLHGTNGWTLEEKELVGDALGISVEEWDKYFIKARRRG